MHLLYSTMKHYCKWRGELTCFIFRILRRPLEATEKPLGAFLQPTLGQGSQIVRNAPVGDSEGFCVGFEAMCSTSTTAKPAETLAKLAAALPVGEAKRYRVKVSVVPLDE